ncbi:MAG: tetratricopeptide repeat protein, partial [Bacteroidales bacterium]|nr:tetratricopeptide repeat protein [Bacteroidales bacterium]
SIAAILVAFLIPAGQVFSQTAASTRPDDGRIIDAVAQMNEGQFQKAGTELGKIVTENPSNDAAWYYLGLCNLYTRKLDEAVKCLKKASELDPSNYWYKDRLALVYSMSGEDDLTIATYEDLLKEFPKRDDLHFNLVNLYLKHNQYDKALSTMDQIEAVFGKNEQVTSTRYDILLRQNKPDEALKALEDYNKDYSSPFVLTKLGDHSMAEDKDTAALGYYQEALDLQSGYMPALLGVSEVYRMRRDYPSFFSSLDRFISDEETEVQTKSQYLNMLLGRSDHRFIQNYKPQIDSLFDKMVVLHPSDTTALSSASLYYYASERQDKGKSLMRRNMDLNPTNLTAAATYVQMLSNEKDWDAVKAACDSCISRFPGETGFLDLKNYACYNKEEWQEIIDNSRKIIEIAKGDTSKTIPALSNIGDMQYQLGNAKEAFKTYEKVLKQDPGYSPALNNYAWYLALQGKKLKKACAMSRKTIEKEPDNVTYLDTYGWILHLLGKDKEAKSYFKHAMLYGGKESASILRHYATVLDALGETDLAKVYRTQANNKEAEGKD